MYDYRQQRGDELNIDDGDVIYVIKENLDGWFEGSLNGKVGKFPGNYVEPMD